MVTFLNGVKNFLKMLNENWTLIVIVIGLGLYTYRRILNYMRLSEQQKIDVAWKNIKQSILGWVSDAEVYWTMQKQLDSAGAIKRSEVIATIFEEYPILNKITSQEEVINKIDNLIDDALDELDEILKGNEGSDEE